MCIHLLYTCSAISCPQESKNWITAKIKEFFKNPQNKAHRPNLICYDKRKFSPGRAYLPLPAFCDRRYARPGVVVSMVQHPRIHRRLPLQQHRATIGTATSSTSFKINK